jgi:hypothetical protein
MERKWISTVLLLAAAGLVGCNSGSTIDTGAGAPREVSAPSELVAQSRPPVPDLPVPLGFTLDQDNSRSFAGAGSRWVIHQYHGRANKWAIGRFYRRQMPINRWTLETDRMIQGTIFLDFSKGNERAVLMIRDRTWPWSEEIRVEVYSVGKVESPMDR